jgi:hypothetical protein
MNSVTLRQPEEERYVFRPWGELALFGLVIALVLCAGLWTPEPGARASGEAAQQSPTLNLSAAGDFQQAVHYNFDATRPGAYRAASFVAPRYALAVSPQDWVRIYTNSPLGPPRSARALAFPSAQPEPCFGNVMIGCVRVDTARGGTSMALRFGTEAGFGFAAPAIPGSYWIALQADWGFGPTTQVFVIDVRA